MTEDKKSEILKEFDPFNQLEPTKNGNPDKDVVYQKDDAVKAVAGETNTDISAQERGDEEPFYDFQLFIKQLQTPGADPLVKYTKSFLRNFLAQRLLWTVSEEIKLINDFKTFIYDKFTLYEPFKSLDNSKTRNAKEGMEKLIMGKLYFRCFSPSLYEILKKTLDDEHMKDLNDDDTLLEKIKHYRFISPVMLDIPDTIPDALSLIHISFIISAKLNFPEVPLAAFAEGRTYSLASPEPYVSSLFGTLLLVSSMSFEVIVFNSISSSSSEISSKGSSSSSSSSDSDSLSSELLDPELALSLIHI